MMGSRHRHTAKAHGRLRWPDWTRLYTPHAIIVSRGSNQRLTRCSCPNPGQKEPGRAANQQRGRCTFLGVLRRADAPLCAPAAPHHRALTGPIPAGSGMEDKVSGSAVGKRTGEHSCRVLETHWYCIGVHRGTSTLHMCCGPPTGSWGLRRCFFGSKACRRHKVHAARASRP
jgi:hypothetical protein